MHQEYNATPASGLHSAPAAPDAPEQAGHIEDVEDVDEDVYGVNDRPA